MFLENSQNQWEHLLNAITNMEYLIVKCQSLVKKLFSNSKQLDETQIEMLSSLINGLAVRLKGNADGPVADKVLGLFHEARPDRHEFGPTHNKDVLLYNHCQLIIFFWII